MIQRKPQSTTQSISHSERCNILQRSEKIASPHLLYKGGGASLNTTTYLCQSPWIAPQSLCTNANTSQVAKRLKFSTHSDLRRQVYIAHELTRSIVPANQTRKVFTSYFKFYFYFLPFRIFSFTYIFQFQKSRHFYSYFSDLTDLHRNTSIFEVRHLKHCRIFTSEELNLTTISYTSIWNHNYIIISGPRKYS